MIGSTYSPQRWIDVEAYKVQPKVVGITGSVPAGTTGSFDTLIADDSLIRGVLFLCQGHTFGDKVSFSVVDVDGIYAPAGTVVSTPISNWNINADLQLQAAYESLAPQKILGGLYVRVTYQSVGLLGTVKVAGNLLFNKVLV